MVLELVLLKGIYLKLLEMLRSLINKERQIKLAIYSEDSENLTWKTNVCFKLDSLNVIFCLNQRCLLGMPQQDYGHKRSPEVLLN